MTLTLSDYPHLSLSRVYEGGDDRLITTMTTTYLGLGDVYGLYAY